jgi:hypothetical protein
MRGLLICLLVTNITVAGCRDRHTFRRLAIQGKDVLGRNTNINDSQACLDSERNRDVQKDETDGRDA